MNMPESNGSNGTNGAPLTPPAPLPVPNLELRPWTFRVVIPPHLPIGRGEVVALSGDCDQLGRWRHDRPILLSRSINLQDTWEVSVRIPASSDVKYRFFVCIPLGEVDGTGENRAFIMRRWETFLRPRIIKKRETNPEERPIETFGMSADGLENVDNGWLTEELILQLKISEHAIVFWKKRFKSAPIRLKLVSVDLSRPSSASIELGDSNSIDTMDGHTGEEQSGWPVIEVSVINDSEFTYKNQPQFGTIRREDQVMLFQVQILRIESLGYMLDFYSGEEQFAHAGCSHILPSALKDSFGSIIAPIQSGKAGSHRPIGQVVIEYLVVRPMRRPLCDLSISYSKHWKAAWTGLDVGHRGMGNSSREFKLKHLSSTTSDTLTACSQIPENTITSLRRASDHGVDFVEFDVQLSKDMVPVLFHDFYVQVGLTKKARRGGDSTPLSIPVKDLTLDQLHHLRILHEDEKMEASGVDNPDDDEPFPTLERALEVIDPHVGFNVEVKWSMQLRDGSWELENPMELNRFIDIILEAVLKGGGTRKIVFSCFHPDICLMIRYKQNKYPVLFLTQGVTAKYPEYNDPRCRSIPVAIYYALSVGILGLSIHTEDILRDPSQVREVTSRGLVAFCWGEDNNCAQTIKFLKELGINGVIYDRLEDHLPHGQKKSIFFTDEEEELMQIANQSQNQTQPTSPRVSTTKFTNIFKGDQASLETAVSDSAKDLSIN